MCLDSLCHVVFFDAKACWSSGDVAVLLHGCGEFGVRVVRWGSIVCWLLMVMVALAKSLGLFFMTLGSNVCEHARISSL